MAYLTDITEVQWAYLAGLVDGEGCIQVSRQRRKFTASRKHGTYYTLVMSIGMTDYVVLSWLTERFGGSLCPNKKLKDRKQVWRWTIAAKQAEGVIRGMYPHLIVKKDQAQLALSFRESYVGNKPRSETPIPIDILEFREHCFHELRRLKKGVA